MNMNIDNTYTTCEMKKFLFIAMFPIMVIIVLLKLAILNDQMVAFLPDCITLFVFLLLCIVTWISYAKKDNTCISIKKILYKSIDLFPFIMICFHSIFFPFQLFYYSEKIYLFFSIQLIILLCTLLFGIIYSNYKGTHLNNKFINADSNKQYVKEVTKMIIKYGLYLLMSNIFPIALFSVCNSIILFKYLLGFILVFISLSLLYFIISLFDRYFFMHKEKLVTSVLTFVSMFVCSIFFYYLLFNTRTSLHNNILIIYTYTCFLIMTLVTFNNYCFLIVDKDKNVKMRIVSYIKTSLSAIIICLILKTIIDRVLSIIIGGGLNNTIILIIKNVEKSIMIIWMFGYSLTPIIIMNKGLLKTSFWILFGLFILITYGICFVLQNDLTLILCYLLHIGMASALFLSASFVVIKKERKSYFEN